MITFLNFTAKQLQSTPGFERKVKKVASNLSVSQVLYSEIINVEPYAIDVLIIDNEMYFHKVHLYSEEAAKMLNSEFKKMVDSFGVSTEEALNSESLNHSNLIDEINFLLSRSIELLNVENTFNIDQLDTTVSAEFNMSIQNFTYQEVFNVLEGFVKTSPLIYMFKVINISSNSAEILAISTECKIYQYTINFDSNYTRFLNRYLSAYVPYEQFKQIRLLLKDNDFSSALSKCVGRTAHTCDFLFFLLSKYKSKISEKGFGGEGLKNVYNFFLETSIDEEDAKKNIRHYFINVPTYEQKLKMEQEE